MPTSEETQKATRLVEYLLRLATLRTKLIREIADYEKVLWLSAVPDESGCFTKAWGAEKEHDEEHERDEWMEVKNGSEPELPAFPARFEDWVNLASLRDKDGRPKLQPEITRQTSNPDWREGSDQPETLPQTERLEDDPDLQRAWDRYVEDEWLPWTIKHNAWEKVHKVYSDLFAIHQEQLRLGEEYELVLGLGLLTWQTPNGQRVRRHLVVADAILDFEARLEKFTVRPHTDGAKLRPELDMLDIGEQPAGAEQTAKESLVAAKDDPWEKSCVEGVLQTLAHSISQGDYEGHIEAKNIGASEKPIVEYAPALILRKRSTRGLTETLKRIKEQIEGGTDIPDEFADLAEIRPSDDGEPLNGPEEANAVFDGEVFFPKPSNDEQRRIVDKLRAASGVLVQGPPGTGKSHTIANLICHLLATGKRTLITAKTPRALQVLEKLLPDELRPLCINLLGSGLDERRSLESSVGGILRKNDEWNEDGAKEKRAELEGKLRELREEKARVDRRLRDIRESETHTQSIAEGAYRGTAARIAEAVSRGHAEFEWFTDTPPFDMSCPVTSSELVDLRSKLSHFTPERRLDLCRLMPGSMPTIDQFRALIEAEKQAMSEENRAANGASEIIVNALAGLDTEEIEEIRDSLQDLRKARVFLFGMGFQWVSDAYRDIVAGNSHIWDSLFRATNDVIESIDDLVDVADATSVQVPSEIDLKVIRDDAEILKAHVESGGKLGLWIFRPRIVRERAYFLKNVKVNGHFCSTREHFELVATVARVRVEIEKGWGLWKRRNEPVDGPFEVQLSALRALRDTLKGVIDVKGLVNRCDEAYSLYPNANPPQLGDENWVDRVIASCRLSLARAKRRQSTAEIKGLEDPLTLQVAKNNVHQITSDLLIAIRQRSLEDFTLLSHDAENLIAERQALEVMDSSLARLRELLPDLARGLEETFEDADWQGRFARISDAWHWAQARYWIEKYIRQEDVPSLAKRAKQIEDEINRIIAKLAALYAWSFCFSRLNEDHRRNMKAWQKNVSKITKTGTGKQDFFHRREAQKNLNNCREAIPAWVMPLHRVWDTVDPQPGMFDVIIVDEASQCGFESLPLFYMAKKILVVGDDKQISPEAEGVKLDAVTQLINQYLYDFEHKASFNINRSLFDQAELRYSSGHIVLREHFRCMPEIIRFSNDLCYSNTPLIPLRQYGPNRLPPLEHVFVNGGYRAGSNNRTINRPEAEAIVKRIAGVCKDSRYYYNDSEGQRKPMTIGVVVLQGEAQAQLIENQLLERLGAEEMERRRLICGNPYSFQGGERHIMFLSLVAASNMNIGPLTKAADERRFNVAASRACDQMILFHSVNASDLSDTCLRKRLIEFFENTTPQQISGVERNELEQRASQDNRSVVNPPQPFDSWFEVDVALELLRKRYNVSSQYEFAGKFIDLVVEGGHSRLAIECDGDRWHGPEQYEKDMQRQRQLERCGWEFFRVRESAFYSNKESALAGLWSSLEKRKIFPNGHKHVGTSEDASNEIEISLNEINTDDTFDDPQVNDASTLFPL